MKAQHRSSAKTRLIINVDGASSGNPGPSGAGVIIRDAGGETLAAFGKFLGKKTNNQAEYTAVILALKRAALFSASHVRVLSDSELIVRQMRGEYKVKHPGLKDLFIQAAQLVARLPKCEFVHVPRRKNKDADRLATRAVKTKRDVEE